MVAKGVGIIGLFDSFIFAAGRGIGTGSCTSEASGRNPEPYKGVVLESRVPFGVLVVRVPCYIADLKRDLNVENYPKS